MDLPKNARVDPLGRSHEGKIIYRVIVNDGNPLYLVDASSDTVNAEGKSLFGNPTTGLVGDLIPPHHKQQAFDEQLFATVVVPYDRDDQEPPVKGTMFNGLNKAWIDWYRRQGQGCGLIEASEEGLRRLGDHKAKEWADAPEPVLVPRFAGSGIPSQEWITWYRRKTGCDIKEAVDEGQRRISQLPKQ